FFVEALGVDDGGVDVGEDLEFAGAAHVIAVAGGAEGHDSAAVHLAHLFGREGFDHPLLLRHAADPLVRFDEHKVASVMMLGKTLLYLRALRASGGAVRGAMSRWARARGLSGSSTTVGRPPAACSRMRMSRGSEPSSS